MYQRFTIRQQFVALIGGSAHVQLVYDCEAYTCGRLLIEHGNQYDRFDAVNFDRLCRKRSQLSRGMRIDDSECGKTFFQPTNTE